MIFGTEYQANRFTWTRYGINKFLNVTMIMETLHVHNLQSFPCFVSAADVRYSFRRTMLHAKQHKSVKSQKIQKIYR